VDLLCSDGEFQALTPDLAPGTYRLGLSRLFQASGSMKSEGTGPDR
jgi:hypothetical protein